MGVGKYSPTVSVAYSMDQKWHDKLCDPNDWIDRDGYDSYGYHKDTDLDRAGHSESDYLASGQWVDDEYEYPLYDEVLSDWSFDGVRPVRYWTQRS